MRGRVLDFDQQASVGLIGGDDGRRYEFRGTDVKSNFNLLKVGAQVDFEENDSSAVSIYVVGAQVSGSKSKIAAGLLAIFLGALGIHKFYLGYTMPGVILLLVTLFGGLLLFIPNLVVAVIVLIEGILYLTKSDEDFENTYVTGTKNWF